jgi:hypothetical protein
MSRQSKKPRNRVAEEALQLWRRKNLDEKLAQGYSSMAEEDRAIGEHNLAAFREILK